MSNIKCDYVYEVGFGTCEESHYEQYRHMEKMSDKIFQRHVKDCLFAVLKKIIKPKSIWKHLRSPHIDALFYECLGSEPTLFSQEMCKRGFWPLKYEQHYSLFGWSSAIDPKDWQHNVGRKQKFLSSDDEASVSRKAKHIKGISYW